MRNLIRLILLCCFGISHADPFPTDRPEGLGGSFKPGSVTYRELINNLPAFENRHGVYFIDAHSQLGYLDLQPLMLQRMREHQVCKTLLSGRREGTPDAIVAFSRANPRLISAAVRIKGGAYISYRQDAPSSDPANVRFHNYFWNQVTSPNFKALGEALIWHAQKNLREGVAPEVKVDLFDPRINLIVRAARRNRWPVILHIEYASPGFASERRLLLTKLKAFLRRNRDLAIVINQMGQFDINTVRRLIRAHRNVYFTTAHSDPVRVFNSVHPWTVMFDRYKLKREWKQLFIARPDRFIFALDNVLRKHWRDYYPLEMRFWISAVNDLPAYVAHRFTHGNAERLWRIHVDSSCRPRRTFSRPRPVTPGGLRPSVRPIRPGKR